MHIYLSCFGRGLDEGDSIGPGQFLGLLCVHCTGREVTLVSNQHHWDIVWVLHAFNLFSVNCEGNKAVICVQLAELFGDCYINNSSCSANWRAGHQGSFRTLRKSLGPARSRLCCTTEGGWRWRVGGGTTQPTNSITSSLQQPARREWGEERVILNDRISNSSYPPPAHRTRPTRQPAKATVIQYEDGFSS